MPGTTAHGYPFPLGGETVDVCRDIEALAQAIDVAVVLRDVVVAAAMPKPGDLRFTARAALDDGWLACDGASLERVLYPDLFAAIDIAYGSVDGAHFTLPDYRGRAAVGAGAGPGLTARALGARLGSETHLLTANQSGVPLHTHPTQASTAVGGDGGPPQSSNGINDRTLPGGALANVAQNAVEAHPNMQPSSVCNVWIKT